VCEFESITEVQIHHAIDKLKPYKAVMEGDIANIVLKETKDLVTPYLLPIYLATFELHTYPQTWKVYDSVVLRKPGRADYTVPKSYRPIVLLKTLAKPLSMAVAEDLSYIAEAHNLLPDHHFGGRPNRATTDAIHLVTKYVQDAWRVGKVASALFLDVKGAFPSVDVQRLCHDMRMRGIPQEYTDWIREKLTGHQTTIAFDDYRSPLIDIEAGLDQGCPISPLCYVFYNSPVIEAVSPGRSQKEMATGFIDDVVLLARGDNFEDANEKLRNIMEKENGVLQWARTHNCEFKVTKFALIGFACKQIPRPLRAQKTMSNPEIQHQDREHNHQTDKIDQVLRCDRSPST
jgi:hypothetical protein